MICVVVYVYVYVYVCELNASLFFFIGPAAKFSSPWLPPWLKWHRGELKGIPSPGDKSCTIVVVAEYVREGEECRLEMSFPLTVSDPSKETMIIDGHVDQHEISCVGIGNSGGCAGAGTAVVGSGTGNAILASVLGTHGSSSSSATGRVGAIGGSGAVSTTGGNDSSIVKVTPKEESSPPAPTPPGTHQTADDEEMRMMEDDAKMDMDIDGSDRE